MRRTSAVLGLLFAALAPVLYSTDAVFADVHLPAVISDNMVIQADKPVAIWGTAAPDEKVTVTIGDDSASVVADAKGGWKVSLKPLKVGSSVAMTVKGNNTLEVKNIIVGSVWICSGQSNMAFGITGAHNGKTEIPKADYPKIRLFYVPQKSVIEGPQSDVDGKWIVCSPKSLPTSRMSAVAYFFGRDVHVATGVPVGLIDTAWGGTPAQSWVSIEGLKKDPELALFVESIQRFLARLPEERSRFAKQAEEFGARHEEWKKEVATPYAQKLKEWDVEVKNAKRDKTPEPPKPVLSKPEPTMPKSPEPGGSTPSALYNGMIAPFIPMPIEGVIWYQGESNAKYADQYKVLFSRLITDWREKWGQGDFPFLFVQLANFEPPDTHWAGLREAQFQTLKLPHTGMAVIIDIGLAGDIHPKDKSDVGYRLAQWALRDVYGKKVVASGPLYSGMKTESNAIRISFTELGSGLTIGSAPPIQLDAKRQEPLSELVGFEIAGPDQKFVSAKAKIDGDTVVVSSESITNPIAVRYAWADNPACNLYNKDGLPASPFRTDNFTIVESTTEPATKPATTPAKRK